MKIYVAGKFQERAYIKTVMWWLEGMGHEITFDWTDPQYQHKDETPEDATECVRGVSGADIYVGVFKHILNYKGALVEMGVALGLGIPVYIVGHAIDSCLFTKHPLVKKFDTLDQLFLEKEFS